MRCRNSTRPEADNLTTPHQPADQSDHRRLARELHPTHDRVSLRVDLVDESYPCPLRMALWIDVCPADPNSIRSGRHLCPEDLLSANEAHDTTGVGIETKQPALVSPVVRFAGHPKRAKTESELIGVDGEPKRSLDLSRTCIDASNRAAATWARGGDRDPESVVREQQKAGTAGNAYGLNDRRSGRAGTTPGFPALRLGVRSRRADGDRSCDRNKDGRTSAKDRDLLRTEPHRTLYTV